MGAFFIVIIVVIIIKIISAKENHDINKFKKEYYKNGIPDRTEQFKNVGNWYTRSQKK